MPPGRRSVQRPTLGCPPVPQRFIPRIFSPRYCFSEMAPVCAVVGGILAQEIVKVRVPAEQQAVGTAPRTAIPTCFLHPARPRFMPQSLPSVPSPALPGGLSAGELDVAPSGCRPPSPNCASWLSGPYVCQVFSWLWEKGTVTIPSMGGTPLRP